MATRPSQQQLLQSETAVLAGPDPVQTREGLCCLSVLSCLLLAGLYVSSLYVWRTDLPRDHPSVIRKRCASVLLVSAVSPAWLKTWTDWTGVTAGISLWAMMGVRLEGLLPAATLPLLLTMLFYLGPLVQSAMDSPKGFVEAIKSGFDPRAWHVCVKDLVWLRNQVVAPLTEELVFGGCMLPMLVPCAGPTAAIFIAPLFFGVAHLHHINEQQRLQQDSLGIILQAAGERVNVGGRREVEQLGSPWLPCDVLCRRFPVPIHVCVWGLHSLPVHENRSCGGPGAKPLLL